MSKTINGQEKYTILYQRLSRDDPNESGESNSIQNQRAMLEKYARDNGMENILSINDDGYSGTGWSRPGWTQLIELIEAGRVANLLVKNLDRMGRDHLRVGLYMEQFQELGIRFIAVNDGIDTANGEDDFTPFRAILAEWYAKDCSRKVKAVFASKGNAGKPLCTQPLYGFVIDPADKTKRIPDPETAPIVRRIFQMTIEGIGPFQIAHIFCDEKIDRPSYYFVRAGILPPSKRCAPERRYNWDGTTIIHIIKRREYMGDMVNFKTSKDNYKSKRYSFNPPEKWLIVEDYYPAIVDKETWALAQKLRKTRRKHSLGAPNPLTGILFCGECGAKMSNRRGVRTYGDVGNLATARRRQTRAVNRVGEASLRRDGLPRQHARRRKERNRRGELSIGAAMVLPSAGSEHNKCSGYNNSKRGTECIIACKQAGFPGVLHSQATIFPAHGNYCGLIGKRCKMMKDKFHRLLSLSTGSDIFL